MSEALQTWRLDSNTTTVLLTSHNREIPALIWYGSRLPDAIDSHALASVTYRANAPAKLDHNTGISLFPTDSSGYLGAPALSGHRDGQHFTQAFTLNKVIASDLQLEVIIDDPIAKLEVSITLALDSASSVLSITSALTNHGDPYTLDWFASATLPLSDQYAECLSMHGRWGGEFQTTRHPISSARVQIENRSGRTSHEHWPGVICGTRGFNDSQGSVLGMHLAWSGNHRTTIERLSDGEAYVQTGVVPLPGETKLLSSQTWIAPTAHLSAAMGMNQMSQRFHHFVRHQVLPPWTRQARPIHANSWEALYFDHSTDKLLALIDAAADIGAERFVLDDGWFTGRRSDNAGLGDWFVDKTIYPDGLHPIVNRIREKHMQFGLWFEPEMVNPDSELYRTHPDWALHVNGYTTPLARQQLVLNLQLESVQNYLFTCISDLVNEYNIDYIKWDMNRDLVFAGDGVHPRAIDQTRGCYALLQRLTETYPTLEIESCASGGGRVDCGILKYTGRVWTSDNIDPIDRLSIQRGFSLFYPPEIMGAHVGHDKAHLTGRVTQIHTRAIVALQGQFGFEFDARKLNEQDRHTLATYTQIYKDNRNWISSASLWRIPAYSDALFISGSVSEDQSQSIWTVVAEKSLENTMPERLVLVGLDANRCYQLSLLSLNYDELAQYAKQVPAWMKETISLPGAVLMSIGLTLPVLPAQTGLLIGCTEKLT